MKRIRSTLKNELPLVAIVAIPFIYLASIWKQLPDKVPMHWNLQGETDRFGHKSELLLIPVLLPLLTYVLLLIVPKTDPKEKIKNMGNKYQSIKVWLTLVMSVLAVFIIYVSKNRSFLDPNILFLTLGFLYTIMGNYFKTIKANYFIGIRTPWTLEDETVWKETHKIGGRLWFAGGLIIVLGSVLLDKRSSFLLFWTITAIITILPIVYSYLRFRKLKAKT